MSNDGSLFAADKRYIKDGHVLFVNYPSKLRTINKQLLLYDLNAIVTAVGGGLGMLLGFSFLSLGFGMVDSLVLRQTE